MICWRMTKTLLRCISLGKQQPRQLQLPTQNREQMPLEVHHKMTNCLLLMQRCTCSCFADCVSINRMTPFFRYILLLLSQSGNAHNSLMQDGEPQQSVGRGRPPLNIPIATDRTSSAPPPMSGIQVICCETNGRPLFGALQDGQAMVMHHWSMMPSLCATGTTAVQRTFSPSFPVPLARTGAIFNISLVPHHFLET